MQEAPTSNITWEYTGGMGYLIQQRCEGLQDVENKIRMREIHVLQAEWVTYRPAGGPLGKHGSIQVEVFIGGFHGTEETRRFKEPAL